MSFPGLRADLAAIDESLKSIARTSALPSIGSSEGSRGSAIFSGSGDPAARAADERLRREQELQAAIDESQAALAQEEIAAKAVSDEVDRTKRAVDDASKALDSMAERAGVTETSGAGGNSPVAQLGTALVANRIPLAFMFLTLEALLLASAAAWVWARNTPVDKVPDEVLSP